MKQPSGTTVRAGDATRPSGPPSASFRLGLEDDPAHAGNGRRAGRPARVAVVSYEVDGITRNGGIGTASSALAETLGAAGHDVTLLYSGQDVEDPDRVAECAARCAARGVAFEALSDDSAARVAAPHFNARRAWDVYRRLLELHAERALDVVRFPECQGHGYYALLARRHGVAFEDVTLCVDVHSSTRWALDAGAQAPRWVGHLVDDHLERRSIELADVVVSPTAYLLDWLEANGVRLPERTLVAPYLLPRNVAALPDASPRAPVDEVVFFGRLEPRKGLVHFCDALDRLAAHGALPVPRVTFLGRQWWVGSQPSGDWLAERVGHWPWQVEVVDGLDQPRAVEYLRKPGRLAVMPSLVDNSPNAVIEAIALGIPFLASRRGGTAELIDPRDLEACTFDPLGGAAAAAADADVGDAAAMARGADSARLAEALRRAVAVPPPPVRFAVEPARSERRQVLWHDREAGRDRRDRAVRVRRPDDAVTVCVTGGAAPAGFAAQGAEVLVDTGPDSAAARNALADAARGDWLLFADPAHAPAPDAVSALLGAAARSAADVVVAPVRRAAPAGEPRQPGWEGWLPIGGPFAAGLFFNAFGGRDFLIHRTAFARLAGFAAGAGAAADWELLARATRAGMRVEVYPEAVAERPAPAGFVADALDPAAQATPAADGTLAPYREALDDRLAELPLIARELFWAPYAVLRDEIRLRAESDAMRAELDDLRIWKLVYERSLSWRLTRPVRWAGRVARRVRRRRLP